MRRPPALALALLATAAIAGCGSSSGDNGSSQSQTPSSTAAKPEQFPSGKGLSLADLRQRYPSVVSLAPGAGVLSKGPTRMPFLLLDKDGKPLLGASAALYTVHPDGSGLRGPFPATARTFGLSPAFISQTAQSDLQITKGFYTADPVLRSTKPANMVALVRLDGRLVSTSPAPLGAKFSKTPVQVGQMAPRVHTQTLTDVGGNAKAIDTRVPPATDLLKDDLYDVLGKKPVVLVFATPQLCQSRVCGPVVDVAEQVRSETKADVSFIHNEVYVDNNPNKGLRPQLIAYGLQTEPWIFVIDRTGKVAQRFEGAVSVDELKAAVAKVS
ncbi:MAG TPA: thioredoxin family protein [Solirubrobacteraceae bacterium]|nr:thioredoxin family protein [Solirubrobacteraceae bacterium]